MNAWTLPVSPTLRRLRLLPVLAGAVLSLGLGAFAITAAAQADPAAGPREEANQLEEKSRRMKQEGHHDEALRLMREAESIRARFQEPGDRPAGEALEQERRVIEQKLDRSRKERQELEAAGKRDEAREVERRIDMLERRREELNRSRGPETPGPVRGEAGRSEMKRRLEHLKIAAEHLHAAGLHEAAERINQQAEVIRRRLESRPEAGPGREGMPGGEPRRSAGQRGGGGPGMEMRESGPRSAGGPGEGGAVGPEREDLRLVVRRLERRLERLERALRDRP